MSCPHDFVERETAVTADGYCPLCLAALKAELLEALEDLLDTIPRLTDDNAMAFHKARAVIVKAKGGT